MTQEVAEQYSEAMISLAGQARSVVRDLNPKVSLSMSFVSICSLQSFLLVNVKYRTN